MFAWISFIVIIAASVLFLIWGRLKARNVFARNLLQGVSQTPCNAKELHKRLIHLLTNDTMGVSTRILREDSRNIEAEVYIQDTGKRRAGKVHMVRVELRIEARGQDASAFAWRIDCSQMAARFMGGCNVIHGLALLFMIALIIIMPVFVLSSDDPNVRAQAVQCIHIAHFLWPPFLIMYRYKYQLDALDTQMINRFENLKYTFHE